MQKLVHRINSHRVSHSMVIVAHTKIVLPDVVGAKTICRMRALRI